MPLDIISPDISKFSTNYFILSKGYTDEAGVKYLYPELSTCAEDYPLPKTPGSGCSKLTMSLVTL